MLRLFKKKSVFLSVNVLLYYIMTFKRALNKVDGVYVLNCVPIP
jgi:hypothetical protein